MRCQILSLFSVSSRLETSEYTESELYDRADEQAKDALKAIERRRKEKYFHIDAEEYLRDYADLVGGFAVHSLVKEADTLTQWGSECECALVVSLLYFLIASFI